MSRRVVGPLFGLLLGLVVLGGCAGTDGDNVANAGEQEPDQAPSSSAAKDPEEAALEYVACLREHGMEVEDPGPGGRIKFEQQQGDGNAKAAMEACRHLAPQMDQDSPEAKERVEQMRKFAVCMRENGVEKYPDPDPNQPGVQLNKEMTEDPDFESAQEACRDLLGGGVMRR